MKTVTQKLLPRRALTQKLVHISVFTHRHFNAEERLHTGAFTQKRVYTEGAVPQKSVYISTLLHKKRVYTEKLLPRKGFTRRSF